jgi:septum site-determining protein MinD
MLAVPVANSLHDVLAGRTTLSETLTEGPTGVTVVPGEPALEAYADADPPKLRTVVKTLRRAFDVVFVDTAAGLREENTVLLEMADGVLLVTVPDHVSLTDTTKTGQLAAMVDSEVVGALICRATDDTDLAAIDAQFDFPVLGGIPNDPEAAGAEPLVVEAPDSDAAAAFGAVGATLERVLVEGADAAALDPVD